MVGASPRFRAMLGDRPSGRLGVSEGTFVGWVRQALADGELSVDARLDGGAVRLLFARESERAALLALEPQPNTRFRDIVEESPDIIAVIDRELRHVFVNRAITAATGMSPADFEGKTHADLGMPEELVRYFQGVYRKVFETGQEGAKDFSFQTPSGETREYSSRVVPLREPDGRIEVLLSYARDSTERNRAQADRLALERKLQETQRL